jgi:hypothetical protein
MTTTNSTLNATAKKLIKRDMFSVLLEKFEKEGFTASITKGETTIEITTDMMNEFLENEIRLLDNKNKVDKKPTAKQNANEEIKNAIMALMSDGVERTVSTIMKDCPECAEFSNQRASALVRQLKDEGKLERKEIKRVAYFVKVGD